MYNLIMRYSVLSPGKKAILLRLLWNIKLGILNEVTVLDATVTQITHL